MDGREFQGSVQVFHSAAIQLALQELYAKGVVAFFRKGFQLGLDVVGVEPEHEVGHINRLSKT